MLKQSADPFTASVIQAGCEAAALEMLDTLRKTAMSPIIYEVLDAGTAVLGAQGQLLSSGAGIPGFIGVLDKSVQAILAREKAPVADGDIFILNDPNEGGVTHLNDVVVAQAVFHEQECVAWVATIAHWGDIGGKTPGSMAVDVTEIFAEGLRIPPLRLYKAGILNQAVMDTVSNNSRLPDYVQGDLAAQLAACRRGSNAIASLYQRYGTQAMDDAIEDGYANGRKRALAGLAKMPLGKYSLAAEQDDGAVWDIGIDITHDTFTVDLTAAPDALDAPHNTSRDGALVVCQMLFKSLTDATRFANAGSFSPLKLKTRTGSIFDAGPTKPQGYYFETRIRLFDLLWRLMAQVIPNTLTSGHFATIFGTVVAGKHPDTNRSFTMVEPQMGGWGATTERSGTGPLFSSSHGDTFNCPVEIAEARYGLCVVEKQLIESPELAGLNRGGPGMQTRYEMRGTAQLSAGFSHAKIPVWSSKEDIEGQTNSLKIRRVNGHEENHYFVSGLKLEAGDQIVITTAAGGYCEEE